MSKIRSWKFLAFLALFTALFAGCEEPIDNYEGNSNGNISNSGGSSSSGGNDQGSSTVDTRMIGTWERKTSSYTYTYYFLEDGKGYYQSKRNSPNGMYRRGLKWKLNQDVLEITLESDEYFSSSTKTYDVTFGDNNVTLTSGSSEQTYVKKNSNGTTSIDYTKPPYTSYIRVDEYYYALSKAVMRTDHNTQGLNWNSKELQLFGENGTLEPIGLRFVYYNYAYESISREWADGTYNIDADDNFNSVPYYQYVSYFYFNYAYETYTYEGQLTIQTNGNIKTIDFRLGDYSRKIKGHFVGTVQ